MRVAITILLVDGTPRVEWFDLSLIKRQDNGGSIAFTEALQRIAGNMAGGSVVSFIVHAMPPAKADEPRAGERCLWSIMKGDRVLYKTFGSSAFDAIAVYRNAYPDGPHDVNAVRYQP